VNNEVVIYIDFDSCYYNISRKVYHLPPWTIITNKFNHMISVPHWLENRLGVKKITYLAIPRKVKLRTNHLVRVFCIDNVTSGRDTMTKYLEDILGKVKMIAPDAHIIHKDSITTKVECSSIREIKKVIKLPCTIGVGLSEEIAKEDYKVKKQKKKNKSRNFALYLFWILPMILYDLVMVFKEEHR